MAKRPELSFENIMMSQAIQIQEKAVYCRYCGQNIKTPTKASSKAEKGYVDPWELENEAHITCYRQNRTRSPQRFY